MYHNSPEERHNPASLLLLPPRQRQHQSPGTLQKQPNKTNRQTYLDPNKSRLSGEGKGRRRGDKRKGKYGRKRRGDEERKGKMGGGEEGQWPSPPLSFLAIGCQQGERGLEYG